MVDWEQREVNGRVDDVKISRSRAREKVEQGEDDYDMRRGRRITRMNRKGVRAKLTCRSYDTFEFFHVTY
jgi:hypothetical protein